MTISRSSTHLGTGQVEQMQSNNGALPASQCAKRLLLNRDTFPTASVCPELSFEGSVTQQHALHLPALEHSPEEAVDQRLKVVAPQARRQAALLLRAEVQACAAGP